MRVPVIRSESMRPVSEPANVAIAEKADAPDQKLPQTISNEHSHMIGEAVLHW
jgi:hypothetical protein